LKKRIEDDSGFCGSDLSRTDGRLYRKSDVFRERRRAKRKIPAGAGICREK